MVVQLVERLLAKEKVAGSSPVHRSNYKNKMAKEQKTKKLYRSSKDRMVSGLLGGVAEYMSVDPTILRLGYVVATAFTGFMPGLVAYILGVIIVPAKE